MSRRQGGGGQRTTPGLDDRLWRVDCGGVGIILVTASFPVLFMPHTNTLLMPLILLPLVC